MPLMQLALRRPLFLFFVLALDLPNAICQSQQAKADAQQQMQTYLESRIAERPTDASAWRLLGKHRLVAGNPQEALSAFERAVELSPENAAAHCGLAECLLALDRTDEAAHEFSLVVKLAPTSEYAQQARGQLAELPASSSVVQASYEVKRFVGSRFTEDLVEDQIDTVAEPARRWSMQLETGALYNSNVALTPISREFSNLTQSSPQAIFNPSCEVRVIENESWTIGNTFNGYFTVNEDEAFGALNLQSYQPGVYVERMDNAATSLLVSRMQYNFTHDEFDGTTFGNRHAGTASLTSLWDSGSTSVVYWTTDFTNFMDDGASPATSSRDGWTHSWGCSHAWAVNHLLATTFTLGGDLQWADIEGMDYRYYGGSMYVASEKFITETFSLKLEGGLGFRDYYDADISPSRNEAIWRANSELKKQWTQNIATSAVFNYDAFDAKNDLFAADRFLGGIIMTLQY